MAQEKTSIVSRLKASINIVSVEILAVLVLFVGALLAFAYLIREVIVLQQTGFDKAVFAAIKPYQTATNTAIMRAFTLLGTHTFLIPANLVLIAYFAFVKKRKWLSIKIPSIALTSLGLMVGLKHLFGRPRPAVPLVFKADGLSFPSGHALFSVSFYGLLIYIIHQTVQNKWLKWIIIVVLSITLFIIGFSRVYLQVHYATDVIAGFCVGFVWLTFSIWLINRLERRELRRVKAKATQKPEPLTHY